MSVLVLTVSTVSASTLVIVEVNGAFGTFKAIVDVKIQRQKLFSLKLKRCARTGLAVSEVEDGKFVN